MSVPVVPVQMEDRAMIKSMDIFVAANRDLMEVTVRSVKTRVLCFFFFFGINGNNLSMFHCRC